MEFKTHTYTMKQFFLLVKDTYLGRNTQQKPYTDD